MQDLTYIDFTLISSLSSKLCKSFWILICHLACSLSPQFCTNWKFNEHISKSLVKIPVLSERTSTNTTPTVTSVEVKRVNSWGPPWVKYLQIADTSLVLSTFFYLVCEYFLKNSNIWVCLLTSKWICAVVLPWDPRFFFSLFRINWVIIHS